MRRHARIPTRNRTLLSLVASAIIVLVLLFPMPVGAISVSILDLDGREVAQGGTLSFTIEMKIETTELVPVSSVRITVQGPASFTHVLPALGGEEAFLRLVAPVSVIDSYAYGYGYQYGAGDFYGYGYGYFPTTPPGGYGYGYFETDVYGYGYGYGFYGPQTLRWTATLINTQNLPVGQYTLRAEVQSNGVWWGGPPTEVTFRIVPVPIPVVPPAPVVPTPAQIEAVPVEQAATMIAGLTAAQAAAVLEQVSTERVAQILELTTAETAAAIIQGLSVEKATNVALELTPERGAAVMEAVTVDRAKDIVETAVLANQASKVAAIQLAMDKTKAAAVFVKVTPTLAATLAETMVETNVVGTAMIVEEAVALDLPAAVSILQEMSTGSLVDLLVAIAQLPSTPATAAKILEAMVLERTVEVVELAMELEAFEELGEMFQYLSSERLNSVFRALTLAQRMQLLPYLAPETVAKISSELLPLPDLTPTAIEVTPAQPTAEEATDVTVTVENIGTVESGSFEVTLYANNVAVQTLTAEGLAVNATATLTFSWTPQAQGSYTVQAVVDPQGLVAEMNEANNAISTTVTVKAKPKPDLTVEFVGLPQAFETGTAYTIQVRARNIGEAAAGQFNVELKADGTSLGTRSVDGLAAGASTAVSFTWTPAEAKQYTLTASADPQNAIPETNEANNTATATVTVTAPPFPWWIVGVVVVVVAVIVVIFIMRKRPK